MRVLIAAAAERDLGDILDYLLLHAPAQVAGFLADLRLAMDGIANMPLAFPLVPRYERHGVRRRVLGNYLIFYKIEGDQIIILHVLHGARDIDALLFEV